MLGVGAQVGGQVLAGTNEPGCGGKLEATGILARRFASFFGELLLQASLNDSEDQSLEGNPAFPSECSELRELPFVEFDRVIHTYRVSRRGLGEQA